MPNPNYFPVYGSGGLFAVASGTGTIDDPYVPQINSAGLVPDPLTSDLNVAGFNLENTGLTTTALTFAHVDWDATHSYAANEVVSNTSGDGLWYVCILTNTNQQPPNATYWLAIPKNALTNYYGNSGYLDIEAATKYTSPNTLQVIATTDSNFGVGEMSFVFGNSVNWQKVTSPYQMAKSNFACCGGTATDCNQVFIHQGDVANSIQCAGFANATIDNSTGCFADAAASTIQFANYSTALLGATVLGTNDGTRVSYAAAVGQSVTALATNAIAIGKSITNSTASSIELGYSDSFKMRIETLSSALGILMIGLPTADPHVVNQLWNSSGTLKVSAG